MIASAITNTSSADGHFRIAAAVCRYIPEGCIDLAKRRVDEVLKELNRERIARIESRRQKNVKGK